MKQITIPERFWKAVKNIIDLQDEERYLGAYIFGSVAEGTSTDKSDLDVRVIVNAYNKCRNINHPVIDDYKLDLTFRSLAQELEHNEQMIKNATRRPNLAAAHILFDKTGKLVQLKTRAQEAKPETYTQKDYQFAQFMVYHASNKAERFLVSDPVAALFAMHCNLQEMLKIHYRIQGRWQVSSKALLQDLRNFDPPLAKICNAFVLTADVNEKYEHWMKMVNYILAPIGGPQPISENNCHCVICKKDLYYFCS
jgi:hypothetical protein